MKLESERRFLNMFICERFLDSLTADELRAFAQDGRLPDPVPNRPSRVDGVKLMNSIKLRAKQKRIFGGFTRDELICYGTCGVWPRKRLHYSTKNGGFVAKWQIDPAEDDEHSAGAPIDGLL
jgi:hypothetical protein